MLLLMGCDDDPISAKLVYGCTIPDACNFNPDATIFDGTCYYPDSNFQCSDRYVNIPLLNSWNFWKQSSVPIGTDDIYPATIYNRFDLFAYNPYNAVPIQDIWPDMEVAESGQQVQTLWLEVEASPYYLDESSSFYYWGGITYHQFEWDYDLSSYQYLDIWMNFEEVNNSDLELHIDLGQISEDINNDNKLNTEDEPIFGFFLHGNMILDEFEDVGIDGCPDMFEDGWGGCLCSSFIISDNATNPFDVCIDSNISTFTELYYEYCSTECDSYSINNPVNCCAVLQDPNRDDYPLNPGASFASYDYSQYNGTEGNSSNVPYPESEDLNNDHFLNDDNDYFTLSFKPEEEIDSGNSSYIISETGINNAWKLYRIPLEDFEPISEHSEVSWSRIENVRLWLSEEHLHEGSLIKIAKIQVINPYTETPIPN